MRSVLIVSIIASFLAIADHEKARIVYGEASNVKVTRPVAALVYGRNLLLPSLPYLYNRRTVTQKPTTLRSNDQSMALQTRLDLMKDHKADRFMCMTTSDLTSTRPLYQTSHVTDHLTLASHGHHNKPIHHTQRNIFLLSPTSIEQKPLCHLEKCHALPHKAQVHLPQ